MVLRRGTLRHRRTRSRRPIDQANMKTRTIGVATLLLLPIFFSFVSAEHIDLDQSNTSDWDVRLTLTSGKFRYDQDHNKRLFGGFIGYLMVVENNGNTTIQMNWTAYAFGIFTHKVTRDIRGSTGGIGPLGWWERTIPLSWHPIQKITVKVWLNTSTNLTIERSGLLLFSIFCIWLTGPESVTGPS